jgi:DNA-binding GntR family transcriptional regulator
LRIGLNSYQGGAAHFIDGASRNFSGKVPLYRQANDRRFWGTIFEKAQRPILWEVFRQLDDRLTRYNPLVLKLFPDPATRSRQREVLIEFLRKGEVDEAVRAFKKIYLGVVHRIMDHLETDQSAKSAH